MRPQEVLVVFFAHALSVKMWAFQDIVAWILCSSENMPGFPEKIRQDFQGGTSPAPTIYVLASIGYHIYMFQYTRRSITTSRYKKTLRSNISAFAT